MLILGLFAFIALVGGFRTADPAAADTNNVLVFGDQDNGYEADNVAASLRSLGRQVTRADRLPADLSTFQQIWYVEAYRGLDPTEGEAIAAYVKAGGSVYLTGERPCCESLNETVQSVLRAVLRDQNVQVGGLGDISGPFTFNFNAVGGIAAEPNVLIDFVPKSPGGIDGLLNVSNRNVFASSSSTAVGAVWAEDDMISGKGRIALLMDIDWLGETARLPIIENIENFLAKGVTCQDSGHWAGFAWFGNATATDSPRNCTVLLGPSRVRWRAASDAGPVSLTVTLGAGVQPSPVGATGPAGPAAACKSSPGQNVAEITCDFTPSGTGTQRILVTASDSKGSTVRRYGLISKNDPRNVPVGWGIDSNWWDWPDADDDGLPDLWEQQGVWVSGQKLDLPGAGADPKHKDLFLHVDYQQGQRLSQGVFDRVRQTFADSPFTNPDGRSGVSLHIQEGSAVPGNVVGNYDLKRNDIVRVITYSGFAGMPERGGGGVPQIYKHFLNHSQSKDDGGSHIIGRAQVKGSYGWTALDDVSKVLSPFQVGVLNGNPADFMRASNMTHELGHTLGLRHHGADATPTSDPRYKSVMSYAYSLIGLPGGFLGAKGKIDYARAGDLVNEDWRRGSPMGAMTFIPGQDGELSEFYEISANTTVPLFGEEPVAEAPAEEIAGQSDPVAFQEFASQFQLQVNNRFPTAANVSGSGFVGEVVRIVLEGSDPDGTPVTFRVMDGNGLTASVDDRELVVDTTNMTPGQHVLWYRSESDRLASSWGEVTLNLSEYAPPAPTVPEATTAPVPGSSPAAASRLHLGRVKWKVRHRRVTLSWKAVPNATSYRVRVSKPTGKKYSKWFQTVEPRFKARVAKKKVYKVQVVATGPHGTSQVREVRVRT